MASFCWFELVNDVPIKNGITIYKSKSSWLDEETGLWKLNAFTALENVFCHHNILKPVVKHL